MTEPSEEKAKTKPISAWARPLALTTAVVFCISAAFPVGAGLSQNASLFPKWWGILDVVVAFLLAALAIVIAALAEGKVGRQARDTSYRAYRVLSHGILVLIVVFFLFGDQIVWLNCLPGFAWRTWVLIYSLPAWLTALRGRAAGESDGPRRSTNGSR
jgi:hypothetical protein